MLIPNGSAQWSSLESGTSLTGPYRWLNCWEGMLSVCSYGHWWTSKPLPWDTGNLFPYHSFKVHIQRNLIWIKKVQYSVNLNILGKFIYFFFFTLFNFFNMLENGRPFQLSFSLTPSFFLPFHYESAERKAEACQDLTGHVAFPRRALPLVTEHICLVLHSGSALAGANSSLHCAAYDKGCTFVQC